MHSSSNNELSSSPHAHVVQFAQPYTCMTSPLVLAEPSGCDSHKGLKHLPMPAPPTCVCRPWFAPITWLLPDHVAKNVHLKIGVRGGLENGKVRKHVLLNLQA